MVAFTLYRRTGDTPTTALGTSAVIPVVFVDKWETYNFDSSVLEMRLDYEEVATPESIEPVSSKMYLNRSVKPSFKDELFVVVSAGANIVLVVAKPPASDTSG